MNFDFTKIERGTLGNNLPFPEGVIRVTKNHIIVAEDLGNKVKHAGKYTTEQGSEKTMIKLAVDTRNQAVALQGASDAQDAFSFVIEDSGRLWANLPTGFRRQGLPTGDYKAVEGYQGPGVAATLAR